MAAAMDGPAWRTQILTSLERRDRLQSTAFQELIEGHAKLARSVRRYEETTTSLTEENARMKDQVEALQRALGSGKGAPPVNQKELDDLRAQLSDYQGRLLEALSKENQAHTRISSLSDQLRRREEELKRKEESEIKLHERLYTLERQVKDLQELVSHKELAAQVLHDELQALQLELLNRENKMKELEMENRNLIERWLQKLNDEAAQATEGGAAKDAERMRQSTAGAAAPVGPIDDDELRQRLQAIPMATVVIPTNIKKRFPAHEGEVNCIQSSSNGRLFATGSNDRKIKIFDAAGSLKSTISGSQQGVMCVQFSHHDDLILGASNDHATRLWSVETGRMRHTLTGHIGKVFTAKFSTDSTRIVSGSHDRTLKVWDLQKGNCIRTIFSFSSCNDLCLMDDAGTTIASGHLDNEVRIWDTKSGECVNEVADVHQGQITSLCLSPDHMHILTSSRDNTLKLIDQRMYQVVTTFSAEGYRNGMNWSRACFSPDGAYVLAGGQDGTIFVWNTHTAKVETTLRGHQAAVAGVSWNPFAGYVYSADKNKNVIIWEP